jgi:hypothetical protein
VSTTEKQIAHAHKVSQMVTDYHSKMAITKHKLTDNPSADVGIFNKLAPELRNNIYARLFEDVFQPDPNDTPCACRLDPGECEHTGPDVYKPLSRLRPFVSLLATCKLFRSEAQALLYVDYIPHTAWVARGVQGFSDIKEFLRSIRPEDRTKVQITWRLENVDLSSVTIGERSEELHVVGVAEWIGTAIDRHEYYAGYRGRSMREPMYSAQGHVGINLPRPKWVGGTPRFYYGGRVDLSTRRSTAVVVNGPLQVIFWKEWQKQDWEKESDERYRRIVRM